jgi:hypothetical protein
MVAELFGLVLWSEEKALVRKILTTEWNNLVTTLTTLTTLTSSTEPQISDET